MLDDEEADEEALLDRTVDTDALELLGV